MQDFRFIIVERVGYDNLNGIEARAVMDLQEGKSSLGIAPSSNPALDGDERIDAGFVGEKLTDGGLFWHGAILTTSN